MPSPAPSSPEPSSLEPKPLADEPVAPDRVPDRYWPFLVSLAAVAGLAELAYAIVNHSTIPVFVKFGLDLPKLVGLATASFLLSEALLNGVMGVLTDRVGRRVLMIVGPLISVATSIATALLPALAANGASTATVVALLFGLRFLDGAGAAMLWPAIFASIGDRVPREKQASAMSVLNVTYMIGLAFAPKVGGALNDAYAARNGLQLTDAARYIPAFGAAAVCFLLCAVVAVIVAPRKAKDAPIHTGEDAPAPADAGAHGPVSLSEIGAALRRSPMLLILVFVVFLGIGLIAPNVKLFAMERFRITESFFGTLQMLPALVIAALAVPVGRLGDVWGKQRAIHAGMALCAISLWALIVWENVWAMVVLGSLMGVGFILTFPAYMALLSDIGGAGARGSLIGAVRTAQGVAMLLGAAAASPLYERTAGKAGAPPLPFVVAGVLLTIGLLLSLVAIREPKQERSTG